MTVASSADGRRDGQLGDQTSLDRTPEVGDQPYHSRPLR